MKFGMRKPSLKMAIGYMPGHLKELAAGELQKKGVEILNDTDRKSTRLNSSHP